MDERDLMKSWGRAAPAELERLVVVSPHLDDAVLGVSALLHACHEPVVVTLFAGRPATYPDPPTEWDALGGFAAGDDVLAARRLEDHAALAELGATPVWLDAVDSQYRTAAERVAPAELAGALAAALRAARPTAVAVPFGLGNEDHVDTHDAAMIVRDRWGEPMPWFCYEDTGYKHIPGLLAWRLSGLFRNRRWPTPCAPTVRVDAGIRRRAFAHYRSQVAALRHDWHIDDLLDAPAPEQLWRIEPPPPGWEALIDLV